MKAFAAAAKEVLRNTNLYDVKWRQHGLGMLQGEITEDIRVHLWHPKLRTLNIDGFRDVHDHRFTLTSYVAHGTIIDIPFTVTMGDARPGEGDTRGYGKPIEVYEIMHAKEQKIAGAGCSTATQATLLGRGFVQRGEHKFYKAGSAYKIMRRDFHTTRIEDLAITVVFREDFDDKLARVLSTIGDTFIPSAMVPESLDTKVLKEWVLREASYAVSEL